MQNPICINHMVAESEKHKSRHIYKIRLIMKKIKFQKLEVNSSDYVSRVLDQRSLSSIKGGAASRNQSEIEAAKQDSCYYRAIVS